MTVDLLFVRKGSQIYIPIMKRAVPQSWGTSNGTFKTNKVGEVTLSFVEDSLRLGLYSATFWKMDSLDFLRRKVFLLDSCFSFLWAI